jgi:hypothetical protein
VGTGSPTLCTTLERFEQVPSIVAGTLFIEEAAALNLMPGTADAWKGGSRGRAAAFMSSNMARPVGSEAVWHKKWVVVVGAREVSGF